MYGGGKRYNGQETDMAITGDDVATMGQSIIRHALEHINETLEYDADKERVVAYLAGWFEGALKNGF